MFKQNVQKLLSVKGGHGIAVSEGRTWDGSCFSIFSGVDPFELVDFVILSVSSPKKPVFLEEPRVCVCVASSPSGWQENLHQPIHFPGQDLTVR